MIGFVKCGIYEKLTEHLSNEIPSYIKKKINLDNHNFVDSLYIFFDTFEGQ